MERDTIRYTRTKDNHTIYAISRGWPGTTLKLQTVEPKKGSKIYMLGWSKPMKWTYSKEKGLEVRIPKELQEESKRPCKYAWSFKITV